MGVKMTLINIIKIYWNTSFNHYCHQRRTAWDRDMNSKEKTERDRIKEKSRYIKNIERGNNIFICMCVTWEVVSFLPPLAAVKLSVSQRPACQNDMFNHLLPIMQDNSCSGWISSQCETTDSSSFLPNAHSAHRFSSKDRDYVSPV